MCVVRVMERFSLGDGTRPLRFHIRSSMNVECLHFYSNRKCNFSAESRKEKKRQSNLFLASASIDKAILYKERKNASACTNHASSHSSLECRVREDRTDRSEPAPCLVVCVYMCVFGLE